jgi:hypothetical protein
VGRGSTCSASTVRMGPFLVTRIMYLVPAARCSGGSGSGSGSRVAWTEEWSERCVMQV